MPPASEERERFGASGQIVLSLDRLAGAAINITKLDRDDPVDPAQSPTLSTINRCSSTNASTSFFQPSYSGAQVPAIGFAGSCGVSGIGGFRWGADVFVARAVSLGGSFAFDRGSGDGDTTYAASGTARYSHSSTSFTAAPRVGYVHPLGTSWALWPRLGLAYSTSSSDSSTKSVQLSGTVDTSKYSASGQSLSVEAEAKFVLTAVSHFALMAGPFVVLPLWNRYRSRQDSLPAAESRYKAYSFGVSLGILAYF